MLPRFIKLWVAVVHTLTSLDYIPLCEYAMIYSAVLLTVDMGVLPGFCCCRQPSYEHSWPAGIHTQEFLWSLDQSEVCLSVSIQALDLIWLIPNCFPKWLYQLTLSPEVYELTHQLPNTPLSDLITSSP